MLRKIFAFFLLCIFLGLIAAAGVGYWGYLYITRDLPDFRTVDDYRPKAVTRVLANDGTVVAEFYEEHRYPVKIKDVPVRVRNAFIAAEDAGFYQHGGIDPVSIARAVYKNFQHGSATQGGSTITQQVVKNLLLTPEKKIKRKLKEAILSYRLEERLSKDEILEIYLNQIFFGNTAYGVKAASELYFHKPLEQLSIAEASLLAALPKAPSRYSPLTHMDRAKRRQRYVLSQMVKAGMITAEEADAAGRERVVVYPASAQNIFRAPYFVSEVRRLFSDQWRDYNIDTDGLEISTSLDLKADTFAQTAVRRGLREVDKRRGWRGPIGFVPQADHGAFVRQYTGIATDAPQSGEIYPAMIASISRDKGTARVDLGSRTRALDIRQAVWAKKRLDKLDHTSWVKPEELLRVGDVVEVSLAEEIDGATVHSKGTPPSDLDESFVLNQTPEIEGALVMLDPNSGRVLTVIGGYNYTRSQFNRATQGLRQPGSAFKPIVYLSAVDGFGYTPATIVHDAPRTFRVGDEFWTPANFDNKFLGPITLRVALEKSRNLVSADIVSRIGIDAVIKYARLLGIQSPLGHNLSLALGSSEVSVLELTRAYGVFAAKGILFDSSFITKIRSRDGIVLYDAESDAVNHARRVLNENSAFVMAQLMKGVIEHGTGYKVRPIGRPVAGKTGTSNDQMDAWFIGYTPQYVCGVWTGFDTKKEIGDKETGGMVSAPTWLYTMKPFLEDRDKQEQARLEIEARAEAERLGIEYVPPEPVNALDFGVPEGVEPFWVDKSSGVLSEPNAPGAIYEYFVRGTEPSRHRVDEVGADSYLDSPEM